MIQRPKGVKLGAMILFATTIVVLFQNCGQFKVSTTAVSDLSSLNSSPVLPDTRNLVAKVAFTGPSHTAAGECSSLFKVMLSTADGVPVAMSKDAILTLPSEVASSLYSDSACSVALTSVSVLKDDSEVSFYFKNAKLSQTNLNAALGTVTSQSFLHTNYKKELISIDGGAPTLSFLSDSAVYNFLDTQMTFSPNVTLRSASISASSLGLAAGNKILSHKSLSLNTPILTMTNVLNVNFSNTVPVITEILNKPAAAIVYSGSGSCALSMNEVYCWDATTSLIPKKVPLPAGAVSSLVGKISGVCALVSGTTYCWIGIPDTAPAAIPGLDKDVEDIRSMNSVVCGLKNKVISCASSLGNTAAVATTITDAVRFLGGANAFASMLYVEGANGKISGLKNNGQTLALDTSMKFDEVQGLGFEYLGCGRSASKLYCWNQTLIPQLMTNAPLLQ